MQNTAAVPKFLTGKRSTYPPFLLELFRPLCFSRSLHLHASSPHRFFMLCILFLLPPLSCSFAVILLATHRSVPRATCLMLHVSRCAFDALLSLARPSPHRSHTLKCWSHLTRLPLDLIPKKEHQQQRKQVLLRWHDHSSNICSWTDSTLTGQRPNTSTQVRCSDMSIHRVEEVKAACCNLLSVWRASLPQESLVRRKRSLLRNQS
jgi:hypothetical protein